MGVQNVITIPKDVHKPIKYYIFAISDKQSTTDMFSIDELHNAVRFAKLLIKTDQWKQAFLYNEDNELLDEYK